MRNKNGIVIYRGPSMLDGNGIVVVLTGLARSSRNGKTGTMLQTWILPDEFGEKVSTSVRNGKDVSVCGDCPHRPLDGASCYVNHGQGPDGVKGCLDNPDSGYDSVPIEFVGELLAKLGISNPLIRFGTYGDPSAVPLAVWETLASLASGRTGYTHQWDKRHAQGLRSFTMASCDTREQAIEAQAMGWRTFRVRTGENDTLLPSEIICPASEEAGKRRSCETCKACDGNPTESTTRRSVTIIVHGLKWKVNNFREVHRRLTLDMVN